jgi:phosphate transport system protein
VREQLRRELQELDTAIAVAGEQAVALLARAVDLLGDPDERAAQDIIAGAVGAQATQEDIESAVERAMALQAPVARDLRLMLAAALVAYHIERVAANAGRIARRTLDAPPPLGVLPTLQDMGAEACRAMQAAVSTFGLVDPRQNVDLEAAALRLHDLEHRVIENLMSASSTPAATTAILAARYLTRVGEHASAIGHRTATVAFGRADLQLDH